jgi:hypothetical protein
VPCAECDLDIRDTAATRPVVVEYPAKEWPPERIATCTSYRFAQRMMRRTSSTVSTYAIASGWTLS